MRRRDLLSAGAAALAAWPVATRAQRSKVPVVGLLFDGTNDGMLSGLLAFRAGLRDAGFIEGENVAILYRFADGDYERLPGLAADLVQRDVDVIFTPGMTAPTAKSATSVIPIVFALGVDPIKITLVANLNRPEGNLTGTYFLGDAVTPKQIEMLHRLVPGAATIGILGNRDLTQTEVLTERARSAAHELGLGLEAAQVRNTGEFDTAFATFVARGAGAILVLLDPLINSERARVAELALRHNLPAMSFDRDFAVAGGLVSYGVNFAHLGRQAGVYVGRILKGAKPADLPIVQSENFQLVLNLRTARTLGIAMPPTIIATADEVIE